MSNPQDLIVRNIYFSLRLLKYEYQLPRDVVEADYL